MAVRSLNALFLGMSHKEDQTCLHSAHIFVTHVPRYVARCVT